MIPEKTAHQGLILKVRLHDNLFNIQIEIPQQGLNLQQGVLDYPLFGRLTGNITYYIAQVFGGETHFIRIETYFPAFGVMFRQQPEEMEGDLFFMRVPDGFNGVRIMAEMHVQIKIVDTEQLQDAFPAEAGTGLFQPQLYKIEKIEKTLCFRFRKAVHKILAHVKKEIRGKPAQSAHNIQEQGVVHLEITDAEIFAFAFERGKGMREKDEHIVFLHFALSGEYLQYGAACRTYARNALFQITGIFAERQIGQRLIDGKNVQILAFNVRISCLHIFHVLNLITLVPACKGAGRY